MAAKHSNEMNRHLPTEKITPAALTLSLPKVLTSKLREKSGILFCKMVKNKQYRMKALLNSFNLNGHTLGFHPQNRKVKPHLFVDSGSERVKAASYHGLGYCGCLDRIQRAKGRGPFPVSLYCVITNYRQDPRS